MSRVVSSVARIALLTVAWLGTIASANTFASDAPAVGSINFTAGYKSLSGDWNLNPPATDAAGQPLPSDRTVYPTLGVEGTWGRKNWPVHIALDFMNSADDGIAHIPQIFSAPPYDLRFKAHVMEFGLGARRAFDLKFITPYLGGGLLWSRGEVEVEVIDPNSGPHGTQTGFAHSHSSAFGYWIGGGLYRRLGPRFQMGLGYRLSKATLPSKPFTVESGTLPFSNTDFPEVDAGGRTINLVVGWSFPSR